MTSENTLLLKFSRVEHGDVQCYNTHDDDNFTQVLHSFLCHLIPPIPSCRQLIITPPSYHTYLHLASFPGLHAQLLSLAVRKAGGRPGRSRHVIRVAINVTGSLLELITQGVRPPYVPISTRADGNGRRQSLEASHRSRIREQ